MNVEAADRFNQIDVKGSKSSDSGGTLAEPQAGTETTSMQAKSDTDSGKGKSAMLNYKAARTGITHVQVSVQSGESGAYTVSIRELTRPQRASPTPSRNGRACRPAATHTDPCTTMAKQ